MATLAKGLTALYDIVSLPLYFVVQQPWKSSGEAKKHRGRQVNAEDVSSAWIRSGPPFTCLASEHQTLDTYISAAFAKHSTKKCFGVRPVVNEEEEVQKNGKKLVKKTLSPAYCWYTYNQVDFMVDSLMKGFIDMGIKPKDVVVILLDTCMEWMLAFLALNRMGAVVSTLYSTLGEQGLVHGINLVESPFLITGSIFLRGIRNIAPQLTHLKTIICVDNSFNSSTEHLKILSQTYDVHKLSDVEARGKSIYVPSESIYHPTPEDLAVIMFTSGSTGTPKGVLIDHAGLLASVVAATSGLHYYTDHETCISYLPLSHIFELSVELVYIGYGVALGFSSPLTLMDNAPGLKQGCRGDATLLRPTLMAAVPLILDKVKKAVTDKVATKGKSFLNFFEYAVSYKADWRAKGFDTPILNRVVFSKMKQIMGGKLKFIYVGGAPLSPETQRFIDSCLDVKIMQGYGATETVGAIVGVHPKDHSVGTVGAVFEGVHLKLVAWPEGGYSPTDKPNPRGEIHVGGKAIARGYYKQEEITEESFYTEDGMRWFKTGDIGEMLPNGSLRIIDRAKDLLKLTHGEYISLGKVEAELKNNQYVENVCVYGSALHSFVVALVSPNHAKLKHLASDLGKSQLNDLASLCNDSDISDSVLKSLQETARQAKLNKYETPHEIILCSEEWSPTSGLLTAAMKIKRKQIYQFYESSLERLYSTDINKNISSS